MIPDLNTICANTITVSAEAEEECEATNADIHVTVRGASIFSGDTALKKAREVASLVTALTEVGIAESAIELRGIQAEVTTGALGNKTSSATYSLRVAKVPLAKVADAIGAITSQKNADQLSTVWKYGDDEAIRLRLLEVALNRAKTKAGLIARTLGVSLLGIHNLTESFSDEEAPRAPLDRMYGSASPQMARKRTQVDSDELGLTVIHNKKVFQTVLVEYLVSPITGN